MKVKRKTVVKKEKYACCDQLFDGRGALIEHDKVTHTDKKYSNRVQKQSPKEKFDCQGCDKKFETIDKFDKHMRLIHMKNGYQCAHCEYETLFLDQLKTHISLIHLKETVVSTEPDCDKNIVTKALVTNEENICNVKNFNDEKIVAPQEMELELKNISFPETIKNEQKSKTKYKFELEKKRQLIFTEKDSENVAFPVTIKVMKNQNSEALKHLNGFKCGFCCTKFSAGYELREHFSKVHEE